MSGAVRSVDTPGIEDVEYYDSGELPVCTTVVSHSDNAA